MRDSHAHACAHIPADGRVDGAARGRIPLHYRKVYAAHRALGELLREVRLGGYGLRNHEEAGGVLV